MTSWLRERSVAIKITTAKVTAARAAEKLDVMQVWFHGDHTKPHIYHPAKIES